MMNIQSAIGREVFAPQDEKLLVAIEVRKRVRRRLGFLVAERRRDYLTFLCLSVTNKRPAQVFITKVKRFPGSQRFARRSQWPLEQLRRVDGSNPNKDSPEFDLVFDHDYDQWVAPSSAEKCMFVQILFHACRKYWEGRLGAPGEQKGRLGAPGEKKGRLGAPGEKKGRLGVPGEQKGPRAPEDPQLASATAPERKRVPTLRPTEFVNCQAKLMGDACSVNMVIYRCKIFLNRMRNSMTSSQAQLQTGAQKPSTAKASTSKMSTSKASNSKASTSKGSTSKASTAKVFRPVPSPPAGRSMGSVVRRASQVFSDRGDLQFSLESLS